MAQFVLTEFDLIGAVRLEIDVDLLADHKRPRTGQIDQDLEHIDIAELARIARIDPARPDGAGDGRNLAVELTAMKRRGANHYTLACPDSSNILLVHFGAHAQG